MKIITAGLKQILQLVDATLAANIGPIGTTFTNVLSLSITTQGATNLEVDARISASNTGAPGQNQYRLVYGATPTVFGVLLGTGTDGGTLSAANIPLFAAPFGRVLALAAGTYTVALQMRGSSGGNAQCRPVAAAGAEGAYLKALEVTY